MSVNFPNLISVRHHDQIKCPDCHCLMKPYLCESAIIDKCENCFGIWFDKNELHIFKNSIKRYDLSRLQHVEGIFDPSSHYQISECPRCNEALAEKIVGQFRKVSLQVCLKCQGQWLKTDQLIQFIDLLKINQLIEPDVKAVAKEMSKIRLEVEYDQKIKQLGEKYGSPVFSLPRKPIFTSLKKVVPQSNSNYIVWGLVCLSIVGSYFGWLLSPSNSSVKAATVFRANFFFESIRYGFYMLQNHSGMHLIVNTVALFVFARPVERRMGPLFFLMMIAASVECAVFLQAYYIRYYLAEPFLGLGGVVAGSIGALVIYDKDTKVEGLFGEYYLAVSGFVFCFLWILIQYFMFESSELRRFSFETQILNFIVWSLAALADRQR